MKEYIIYNCDKYTDQNQAIAAGCYSTYEPATQDELNVFATAVGMCNQETTSGTQFEFEELCAILECNYNEIPSDFIGLSYELKAYTVDSMENGRPNALYDIYAGDVLAQWLITNLIDAALGSLYAMIGDRAGLGYVIIMGDGRGLTLRIPGNPSRLSGIKKYTGELCSVCAAKQFTTEHGIVCENGHGGAPPMSDEDRR